MNEKIIDKSMIDQFVYDSQIYGMGINIGRAVPGFDGLKPVHRRIIYAMGILLRLYPNKKTVKSSSVVGEVMKTLHPHGDVAIYDSLVKMGNWFDLYYPLIEKQGSFGTFQGVAAAAPRYTECKLNEFIMDIAIQELIELENIADYIPNYDFTSKEPVILPIKVPLALIEGMSGIGFGLKVYLPPHNLKDVLSETIKLIKNPNHDVMLYPDQCQKCVIIGNEFEKISRDGIGKYVVRGIVDIVPTKKSHQLIIRSLPDQVYLDTVVDSIEKLVSSNKITCIADVIDQSKIASRPNDPDIMEYIITLKPGTDPNYILEYLYSNTDLQKSYTTSFQLVDGGTTPSRYNYKLYLQRFIEFRKMTKFRYYNMKLSNENTKFHEIEALIKVLESGYIDKIIGMIRSKDASPEEIIEFIIQHANTTDIQARYIMNTRIGNLSLRKLNEYKERYNELYEKICKYRSMIINEQNILDEIISELEYISKKYGKPRNCKIIKGDIFSAVPEGTFKINIDSNNNIKKVNVDEILPDTKLQTVMSNKDDIILFDSIGRMFSYPISKIPFSDRKTPGLNIKTLIKNIGDINYIVSKEKLKELLNFKPGIDNYITLLIVTKAGNVKRITLNDCINSPKSGTVYTKLNDGDKVFKIIPISPSTDVFISNENKTIRLETNMILELKRNSVGSRTIPNVSSVSTTDSAKELSAVITTDGRINLINNISLTYDKKLKPVIKNGDILSILNVSPNDTIVLTTLDGDVGIEVSNLKITSTNSSGTKILPKRMTILETKVV